MSTTTPINRHTEYVVEDDGTKAYKVYNNMSPHYYMDRTGSLNPIDITNLQTITKGTVGEIKLREKSVSSIGFRTDGNKTKYLGLRPDETQESGSQQLEWSIEEAIINNSAQSITLNQTSSIDGVTTNLGGQVVRSTRFSTKQMVPVTGSISNFQVKYKLHLTGLQISNSKYTEDTIVRNDISSSGAITVGTSHYVPFSGYFKITDTDNNVKFLISLPVLLDSNFEQITNDTTHTLKDNGDGTYEYIKYPSDNLLSEGISDDVAYIDAETIYGTDSLDGRIHKINTTTSNNAAFTNIRNSQAGSGVSTSDNITNAIAASSVAFFFNYTVTVYQSFFGFDTSAITTTPTSAQIRLHSKTNETADWILVEATHTLIAINQFNAFTGWESGWDGDNAGGSGAGSGIVPYSAEVDSPANDDYTNVDLLDAALTAIGSNDTFKVLAMEHDYYYKGPTYGSSGTQGFYFSNYTDTDHDPYLYIVLPAAATPSRLTLSSGKLLFSSGRVIIK